MSIGSSRYSKIRSKSASDVCTSRPTPSSEPTGKNSRVCSVVNATSVATSIACEPLASASPPNQYTAAGMTEKLVWIDAITQRPAIRCRTSRSASRSESLSNRSASSVVRPIVLPSRIPETESDSCTRLEMSASVSCVVFAISRRSLPTRRVSSTKTGISANAKSASCQLRRSMPTIVATTVVDVRSDRRRGVRDDVLHAADVVRDARLHLAGARAREERERQALQVAEDGRAQVVHHALADLVREQRLDDAERARDDGDDDHPRGEVRDPRGVGVADRRQQVAEQEGGHDAERRREDDQPEHGREPQLVRHEEPRDAAQVRAAHGRVGRALGRLLVAEEASAGHSSSVRSASRAAA